MRETIGIIGAMDEEVELLLAGMKQLETVKQTGITYVAGEWLGKQIVVCKSGVGKVNAAVTTQILIDRFQVNRIIFTGVAGAVNPELNIGDMVISSECVQHDMDVTPLGFERGVIPYQETSAFPAEASLIALAEEACKAQGANYLIGKVLSGDQFIANKDTVKMLYTEMNGACAEMEGAAVAQVSFMNRVPFVILRAMSDKADGSAHVNFAEFTVESSQRSHRIVEHMLEHM
ncbi:MULTISPECIES: 5'-methylthioadenosine/adenosylhomocysteine nucleosidase [Paenibacillus]|uniref:adenosylhomocysteine nucleosidase n=1 Tax=Paenibacillus taichungensis TaxID=484184 RepID=A0ABX2MT20_9BACL|nr:MULTISPECIES: 5'-methylthioadenosine/adenosylhomocysteine nucleosidase [Paenibacillus]NUU57236.1 5'-methylthioadenosine/adenosylhomocysteine nucleosidase [Paenibacillus taichungensis]PIH57420.1 5'-methylthioadenosine/S-adenosylhomocysteine nucleosidase [Paenibacillus sp. LK1]